MLNSSQASSDRTECSGCGSFRSGLLRCHGHGYRRGDQAASDGDSSCLQDTAPWEISVVGTWLVDHGSSPSG
ncbi:hypothetical protein [Lysobacter gummosus]|uniref:hypothetical protein n=1 Tax=Lysobacter gummosus TaxID=262324 RepID=UPI003631ED97